MTDPGQAIRFTDNPGKQRYEVFVGDRLAGFVTYTADGSRMTLIHTEVAPEFEGQGLGRRLATGALEDIRARGMSVEPMCPFIRRFIQRNPQYADLVAGARTSKTGS
jgi:predicted GNAT family acetyltransferase